MILAVAASIQGCGKPVLRLADASLGDYYTQEEFKKLSREQQQEYCAELARQDSIYRAQAMGVQQELDQSRARSLALRQEGDSMFALLSSLEREVERRGGKTRTAGKSPPASGKTYVVRPGESLWRISAMERVYRSGAGWTRIYAANRARIRNPNRIYPGQELLIPR